MLMLAFETPKELQLVNQMLAGPDGPAFKVRAASAWKLLQLAPSVVTQQLREVTEALAALQLNHQPNGTQGLAGLSSLVNPKLFS